MDGSHMIVGRTLSGLLVPVKVDEDGTLTSGVYGYYNSGWRKGPIPWGASSIYHSFNSNLNLPAGNSQQNFPAFTADTLTIITEMAIRYSGTITNVVLALGVSDGSSAVPAFEIAPIISQRNYCWNGFLVCRPIDTLYAFVQSATAGDDLYYSARGYIMQTNL